MRLCVVDWQVFARCVLFTCCMPCNEQIYILLRWLSCMKRRWKYTDGLWKSSRRAQQQMRLLLVTYQHQYNTYIIDNSITMYTVNFSHFFANKMLADENARIVFTARSSNWVAATFLIIIYSDFTTGRSFHFVYNIFVLMWVRVSIWPISIPWVSPWNLALSNWISKMNLFFPFHYVCDWIWIKHEIINALALSLCLSLYFGFGVLYTKQYNVIHMAHLDIHARIHGMWDFVGVYVDGRKKNGEK